MSWLSGLYHSLFGGGSHQAHSQGSAPLDAAATRGVPSEAWCDNEDGNKAISDLFRTKVDSLARFGEREEKVYSVTDRYGHVTAIHVLEDRSLSISFVNDSDMYGGSLQDYTIPSDKALKFLQALDKAFGSRKDFHRDFSNFIVKYKK